MGFGKWVLVLVAGGVGAGIVAAGMTTGKMQKFPEDYALSGSRGARHDDGDYAAGSRADREDYALSDEQMPGPRDYPGEEEGDYAASDHSGFGPPRGRMVILDGSGWVEDDSAAPSRRHWRGDEDDERIYAEQGRPFIAPQRSFAQPGPRGYAPQPSAPQMGAPARLAAPPVRDSAADSAARAAGAAADVLAAEREGA